MTTRPDRSCWWIIGLAVAVCMAHLPLVCADDPPASPDKAGKPADLTSPAKLEQIAAELRALHAEDDPLVVGLVRDLDTFRQQLLRDMQARAEAREAALERVVEERSAGRLMEALGAALQAAGQSSDPKSLLSDPRMAELVEQTERAADEAAAKGDWLEVMSLYRRLNLLFDPATPYRKEYERAEERVRILNTYAPEQLEAMHRRSTDGPDVDGEPALPEIDVEPSEPWEQALEGVRFRTLVEAIRSARRHVSSPQTRQLVLGAVDRLLLLVDVDGLGKTFPALDNDVKANAFRTFLRATRRKAEKARFGAFNDPTGRMLKRILDYSEDHDILPRRVLVYEMGQGAVGTLDKFSEIVWPYRRERLKRSTQGEFTGVGIQIKLSKDRRIAVVTPIRNTPAFHAGVRPGDIIAEVEGKKTAGRSLDKAVHAITGPEGTTVTLGMERKGDEGLTQIPLVRALVPIESVLGWRLKSDNEWDYHIDRANRIGYIRLTQFVPQSADDLDLAIEQMREDGGFRGLILDLRFNPGGLLRQAVEVANRFVPRGTIVSIVNADRQQKSELLAWPTKAYEKMEMVVLVNRTSASASEIVAGAVQDYGRATIIGTRTYGKGSVQDVFPVDGRRASLKLTTQYYMLPEKRIVHRAPDATSWGIDPDLVVHATDSQVIESLELRREADVLYGSDPASDHVDPQIILDKGADPQLTAALLVLKRRLLADRIRMAQSARPNRTP